MAGSATAKELIQLSQGLGKQTTFKR